MRYVGPEEVPIDRQAYLEYMASTRADLLIDPHNTDALLQRVDALEARIAAFDAIHSKLIGGLGQRISALEARFAALDARE